MSASDQRKSKLFIALAKSEPRVRSATGKSSEVGECIWFLLKQYPTPIIRKIIYQFGFWTNLYRF